MYRVISLGLLIRYLGLGIMFILLMSCNKDKTNIIEANAFALEQSVDMTSKKADTDECLQLEKEEFELGDIPLGETRKLRVKVKNITEKPLVILDVITSCSCTKVLWRKKPIPTQSVDELELSFTAETEGVFFKKVAIRHSEAQKPVSFTIKGVVTPRKK